MRCRAAVDFVLLVAAVLVVECSSATCGDKDGTGTAAVNNTDCGTGHRYDKSKSTAACAGSAGVRPFRTTLIAWRQDAHYDPEVEDLEVQVACWIRLWRAFPLEEKTEAGKAWRKLLQ